MIIDKLIRQEGTAFITEKDSITYSELYSRVNSFAKYLSTLEIDDTKPLGICTDNCLDMAVGVLSLQQLGTAYMVLDADAPAESICQTIRQNDISCLITPRQDIQTIQCIDSTVFSREKDCSKEALAIQRTADTVYQDGIDHVRLTKDQKPAVFSRTFTQQYYEGMIRAFELADKKHIVIFPQQIEQILILDLILAALSAGLSIQIKSHPQGHIPDHCAVVLHKQVFDRMVKEADCECDNKGKASAVIVVGDTPLLSTHLYEWGKRRSDGTLIFTLALPELPLFLTAAGDLAREQIKDGMLSIVPVGKPITDSLCLLLDSGQKPSPVGALGSLYIKTDGVCGTSPKSSESPLYKPRGLGRYLPDKGIQIQSLKNPIGKINNPVDLSLIEDYVYLLKPIKKAAAIKHEEGWHCCISLSANEGQVLQDVVTYLKQTLPPSLLPKSVIWVEDMPKDHKDIAALRHTEGCIKEEVSIFSTSRPENEVQRVIVEIAQAVLKKQEIGIHDDLLDFGIDSIKAIQMVTRLQEQGLDVDIQDLFEYSNISVLSQILQSKSGKEEKEFEEKDKYIEESYSLITHEKDRKKAEELFAADANIEAIYPVSAMQEMILAQNINYRNTGNDITLLRYSVKGEMDTETFRQAWQVVLGRHAILRTAFVWRRLKQPLQVVYRLAELPFAEVDLTDKSPEEQKALYEDMILAEKMSSFDIGCPPLLKVILLKFSSSEWRFILKCQNSLFDGWSSNIIYNELLMVYNALKKGIDIKLKKSYPYLSYILWLKEQNLEAAKDFWVQALSGLELEQDKDKKPEYQIRSTYQHGECSLQFDASEMKQINRFIEDNHLTLYTLIQGAWAILQGQRLNKLDVLIATISSGRPTSLPGVETMAGLFSNTLPIRVQLSDAQPTAVWLKELQEKNIKQKKFEYVTIQQIAQWCQIPIEAIQDVIYSRTLVYLNFPTDTAQGQEGQIQIEQEVEAGYTNVPLRLYVQPSDDCKVILRYDQYYFRQEEVQQLLERFKGIINKII